MTRNELISRRSIIIAALIILVVIVGGVSVYLMGNKFIPDEKDGIKYIIGISQFDLNENWLAEMNREIEQANGSDASVRLIFTDAGGSTQKQIEDMDSLMDLGIDLLIICPNDAQALNDKIAAVHQKIPVIVMHRALPQDDYTCYITANNYDIGYKAGKFIADLAAGQKKQILEVIGRLNSQESQQRSAGFQAALAENTNLNIVRTIEGEWLKDTTEDILAEMYMDLPSVDIIFAHNNAMAEGAYNASKKMRLPKIMVLGVGGMADEEESNRLVREGILECTFTNTLGGEMAYNTAMQILRGDKDIPKNIVLDSQMITQDTLTQQKTS